MSVLPSIPSGIVIDKHRGSHSLLNSPEPAGCVASEGVEVGTWMPFLPDQFIVRTRSIAVRGPQGLKVFSFQCPRSLAEISVPILEWAAAYATHRQPLRSFRRFSRNSSPKSRHPDGLAGPPISGDLTGESL